MTAAMHPTFNTVELPWDAARADNGLYHRVLAAAMAVCLALGVVLPMLRVDPVQIRVDEEPPPLTRVVLEKKALPQPLPAPAAQPRPKPEPVAAKPEPKPVEQPRPTPAPEPKPEPKPEPIDHVAVAKEKAKATGVLAFQDDLMALRDSVDVGALNRTRTSRGAADAAHTQRKLVGRQATTGSGGIQVAAASADTGGPALSGRETTTVNSKIGGEPRAGRASDSAATRVGGRSDDAIRRTMDRNKGAIFAIYNRALRQDPLLEGKLVFEMLIAPSGEITELTLLSSELVDEALTRRILGRIRLIDFGRDDVIPTRVNYSFDFLPFG